MEIPLRLKSSPCHTGFTLPLWVPSSILLTINAIKDDKVCRGQAKGYNMGTKVKEEYVAAGLRQQIESLALVLQEMEKEKMGEDAIAWRLKAVELGLRRLREAA